MHRRQRRAPRLRWARRQHEAVDAGAVRVVAEGGLAAHAAGVAAAASCGKTPPLSWRLCWQLGMLRSPSCVQKSLPPPPPPLQSPLPPLPLRRLQRRGAEAEAGADGEAAAAGETALLFFVLNILLSFLARQPAWFGVGV